MTSITISLIVAACVFAGGIAGILLHRVLPGAHQTKETLEVVRLGTGMLSVLASLVLGLLIATAKTSYDTTDQQLRSYAAELSLLGETLRDYGDTAAVPRAALRSFTARVLQDYWPSAPGARAAPDDAMAGTMLEHVRERIRALTPVDAGQHWLQDQALASSTTLLRQRWLLIEQSGAKIQPIMLVILVFWIAFIFVSFGLNAPRNATVVAAFLICSLAIGGSIFLIMEMDNPLAGTMKISRLPMANALANMAP
jgi:hypothetical protein